MRNERDECVTGDGKKSEKNERTPVSPSIDQDSAGICVDRAERCAQCVKSPDDQYAGTECLKIFWQETRPQLFARGDEDDRRQQQNEIAAQSEKIRNANFAIHPFAS